MNKLFTLGMYLLFLNHAGNMKIIKSMILYYTRVEL